MFSQSCSDLQLGYCAEESYCKRITSLIFSSHGWILKENGSDFCILCSAGFLIEVYSGENQLFSRFWLCLRFKAAVAHENRIYAGNAEAPEECSLQVLTCLYALALRQPAISWMWVFRIINLDLDTLFPLHSLFHILLCKNFAHSCKGGKKKKKYIFPWHLYHCIIRNVDWSYSLVWILNPFF